MWKIDYLREGDVDFPSEWIYFCFWKVGGSTYDRSIIPARGQTLLCLLVRWRESPKVQVEVPAFNLMEARVPCWKHLLSLRALNPKLLRREGSFSRGFTSDRSQVHLHPLISRPFSSGYGGNRTTFPLPHTAERRPASQVLSLTLQYNYFL